MDTFYGQPVRAGTALASAAIVRHDYGLSLLDSARMRRVTEQLLRDPSTPPESEDIILIASEPPLALLAEMVSGYEMRALALIDDAPSEFEPLVPCVAGLGSVFRQAVEEHDIVIVDGASGRVFLSPDAPTVARFQAPTRTRRFHIDEAHLPAKTQSDNRIITVYGSAASPEELAASLDHGADGLLITASRPLLAETGRDPSVASQQRALAAIVDKSGGLPTAIACPLSELALTAVLRNAANAPLYLVANAEEVDRICEEMDAIQAFSDPDIPLGAAEIWMSVGPDSDFDPDGAIERCAGVIFERPIGDYGGDLLLPTLAYARRAGLAVTVRLDDDDPTDDDVEDTVRYGIQRIAVRPDTIEAVKDLIRQL